MRVRVWTAAGAGGEPPAGLLEAFRAYERALADDDVAALDAVFLPGEGTVRGDAAGLLVGHDAVGAFRRSRGGAPPRRIRDVHVHLAGDDAAVVLAVTEPRRGGLGLQTQLWRREPGTAGPGSVWRIAAAQVAAPPVTVDPRVWSVVGSPLVAGADGGPLAGVGVAVKDLFAVAGHRVGGGVPTFLAEAPVESGHAGAVGRLLAAGADVRGIARTDQFAYSIAGANAHYGTPVNAAVPAGLPGGSSSGSATAVALGEADLGLGTDTAGSIRVPASYQGLWGLRTTHDAVDRTGLLALSPDFDTVGLLARDADLLVAAAGVLLDAPPPDLGSAPLLVSPALLDGVDPPVARVFSEAVAALGDVREVVLPDAAAMVESFRVHQAWQAWRVHGPWVRAHPGAVVGDVLERFEIASRVTDAENDSALADLARFAALLDEALGDGVLLLPSASSSAPRVWDGPERIGAVRAATLRLTCTAGITGRPAVSAPLLEVDAAPSAPEPVGLGLVGPRCSDVALVRLAAQIASRISHSSG